ALAVSIFFFLVELFTGLYSDIPSHVDHFRYLFYGIGEHKALVNWMWLSQILAFGSLLVMLMPSVRKNHTILPVVCGAVILAIWIEKGLGMIIAAFVPNTFHTVVEYSPTRPEIMIGIGVYAIGAFILTVLFKIAVSVREELQS
ncbi:MAG: menaquinol oxidoreductase, partial [Deltaproteobacteria bacterium]|nr:menaquinol oxidoreductase [Deltaproteobacteria bacterium]